MRHSIIALLLLLLGCSGSTSNIGPTPGVPPSIGAQPQNQSVTAPATATFSVTATGDAPLAYQWRKNGTDIQSATGAAPSRTITFTGLSLRKIWVDPASDRMYLASRNGSPGGFNIFAFNGAAALTGTIADPDTTSAARMPLDTAMNVMVDTGDRLYFWADSATSVRIFFNASALSGTITGQPDKTVSGVVNKGYGMDYLLY